MSDTMEVKNAQGRQWEQYHIINVKMIHINVCKRGDYAWRGVQVGSVRREMEWQDKIRRETFSFLKNI